MREITQLAAQKGRRLRSKRRQPLHLVVRRLPIGRPGIAMLGEQIYVRSTVCIRDQLMRLQTGFAEMPTSVLVISPEAVVATHEWLNSHFPLVATGTGLSSHPSGGQRRS